MAKYKHGESLFFLMADIKFLFLSPHRLNFCGRVYYESAKVPTDSFSAHLIISIITVHVLGIITISIAVDSCLPLWWFWRPCTAAVSCLREERHVLSEFSISPFRIILHVSVVPAEVVWRAVSLLKAWSASYERTK